MEGLQAKSNAELQSKWLNIIATDFKQYEIFVPVYGIKVERIVNIGLFTLYNFQDCKKFLMDNKYDVTELQEYHNYEKINFLRFTFKAKGSDRAIELSRPYFELFECVVKFLLHDSNIYDIRILNYFEIPNNANYFVFSNEDFLVTFNTDGAKIPVDAEKFFNENNTAKQIFEIMTRYMKKKNTEMEKRIINAIKLVGKANINHSITDKCVQYISALETLLMHKPQDEMIVPGIANRLAECAAFIVGSINNCKDADKEKNFRKKIYSDVKKMYVVRSKIVHGNINETYREINVTEMRLLIETIIFTILKNEEILKFSKIQQLYEWVDNFKFSV